MRALMWRRPTAEQLRGTGLRLHHYVEPQALVWPENWPVIDMYLRYRTQWIQGAAGPAGLNYQPFLAEIERIGLDDEGRSDFMEGLRILEGAVLEEVYRERK